MSETIESPSDIPIISEVSMLEAILFILINIILLLLGIILWYFVWIRSLRSEIVCSQGDPPSFFSTSDFNIVLNFLFKNLIKLEENYIIQTIGYEAYTYLLFQRNIITLILEFLIVSIILSIITLITYRVKGIPLSIKFLTFFIDNEYFSNFSSVMHLITIGLITFLHFRIFTMLKDKLYYLFYDRFVKMSREYDENWLSCRTLHISGLNPEQRKTEALQNILNVILSQNNRGRVIDINFIPDYQEIYKYEIKSDEINALNLLISKRKPLFAFIFSYIYYSEELVQKELDRLDKKMDELIKCDVVSSGHAFICFDSLQAAYEIITKFESNELKKLWIKTKRLFSGKKISKSQLDQIPMYGRRNTSTFLKFNDEDTNQNLEDKEVINQITENLEIMVDQIIDPSDVIWLNVGGGKFYYIFFRLFINIIIILILTFVTTPTSLFSTMKKFDYFKLWEFNWIIKIPFGYLLNTYAVPLVILTINICLIVLICYSAKLEKHCIHTKYQLAIFNKSFVYMLLNLLIIPGLAMTADSLFKIIKTNYKSIWELLSKIYLSNSGYFFITLVIQNGTFSSIYYILRVDELLFNAFSVDVTYYKRHFINIGELFHRGESDCFQFGYFYAQVLVFYTICLVFTTTMPVISITGLYYFLSKHFADFTSFFMVHGKEFESDGKMINHILNMTFVPLCLYLVFMVSVFIIKHQTKSAIGVIIILLVSVLYYIFRFHTKYIYDIYSSYSNFVKYEENNYNIGKKAVNEWRDKFMHPMCIPIDPKNDKRGRIKTRRSHVRELDNVNERNAGNLGGMLEKGVINEINNEGEEEEKTGGLIEYNGGYNSNSPMK